jgi:hypothetical protein
MFFECSNREDVMKHPSRRRSPPASERTPQGGAKSNPPERRGVNHTSPFTGLFKSIFGPEKIERLLAAVRFSYGEAIVRRVASGHAHMRRFGLLMVLLFLQSLFIAIDYLPITLEILGRDRACTYISVPQDRPTEQPGR